VNGLAQILVAEDEPKLAGLLADYLRASGFIPRLVDNGLDVEPAVRAAPPALVLLDLMLPGRDGFDICRDLRRFTDVPIIIITARIEEIDRLLGLQLGADDYICKPFSPREVMARIKAVLRRNGPAAERDYAPPEPPGEVSGLAIHAESHRAELDGQKLDLTPLEFRLLETLASHPGRVFSRSALKERVYDDDRDASDRTMDSHVKNLRRKLAEAAPGRELLHTVHGVGYRLEG
jgi:two-component system, OmpR family, response regulator BaeR